jgi:hypothetical protein
MQLSTGAWTHRTRNATPLMHRARCVQSETSWVPKGPKGAECHRRSERGSLRWRAAGNNRAATRLDLACRSFTPACAFGDPPSDPHTMSFRPDEDARRAAAMYSSLWHRALEDQARAWKAYRPETRQHRQVDYHFVCSCCVCRIRRAFSRTFRPSVRRLLAAG